VLVGGVGGWCWWVVGGGREAEGLFFYGGVFLIFCSITFRCIIVVLNGHRNAGSVKAQCHPMDGSGSLLMQYTLVMSRPIYSLTTLRMITRRQVRLRAICI
jgi:hypothetical protein